MKPVPFLGVEPGGWFVDDDEFRIAEECLRDAESLPHAAGEGADGAPADVPEIREVEQRLDLLVARARSTDAFENGEVVEQLDGRNARIDAECLREIAELPAQQPRISTDVFSGKYDGAGVGLLQRGDGPHERRFASAVRPEQSEEPAIDVQTDVIQRPDAVGISFRKVGDRQHELAPRKTKVIVTSEHLRSFISRRPASPKPNSRAPRNWPSFVRGLSTSAKQRQCPSELAMPSGECLRPRNEPPRAQHLHPRPRVVFSAPASPPTLGPR
jgi:hypothetical protein